MHGARKRESLRPRQTSSLTPPIQPLVQSFHHLRVEGPKVPAVTDHLEVVVVTLYLSVQRLEQRRKPLVPMGLPLFLASVDAVAQFLLRRPSPYPRRSLAVGFPLKLEAEKGEAPVAARAEPTQAVDTGLFRSFRRAELVQPFRQRPVEGLRFVSILEAGESRLQA